MGPLEKIQKAYAFFSESKLRSIFQTCAGQERKLVRRVASQIWSLRDDTGQKCCIGQTSSDRAADRLILQPSDADDLVSETERTRQKIRRDLEKFRRRLQERVQLAVATGYKINTDLCISLSSQIYRLYP